MNNLNNFPLITLGILSYNQEKYIEEAIIGALSQDYPNLEIIISDDCSTDDTFEIIKKCVENYKGNHKIKLNRNEVNLGIVKHNNKMMFELSSGCYLLLSGGDDVCLPNTISKAFEEIRNSDCDSMNFNAFIIDDKSRVTGKLYEDADKSSDVYVIEDYINGRHKSCGACRIIKREIFETFGPLDDDCPTEDSTNLLRTFLYGKVGFCYQPNLKYRIHGNNISGIQSLMTKFDPQKIYNQYIYDINIAREKMLINTEVYNQVFQLSRNYLKNQVAIRKIYQRGSFVKRVFYVFSLSISFQFKFQEILCFLSKVKTWRNSRI